MQIIDHSLQPTEEWRPGVLTKMQVSAVTDAAALCIFEQWIAPGAGTPSHTHPVEEVLTVLEGRAELWLGDERTTVSTGQSVIVPAGSWHGFRNSGSVTLHMQAILAAPAFEASYKEQLEVITRWATAKA
ncbi:cupin domain-containing protein [Mesorhizobium sp.]|uniref:cupin domain-containing protein n=1 Tax=Mesorhizobium sp. TaxID=1871066 RepID=UPI0011F9ED4D|nr:cupin domain-containing protein [Mesorhizobium sp.]TIS45615.1 MAG: cupin domain-containing protein [Mesorhizobium sp.]